MPTATLPRQVIEVADGFWNIRGSFKIAGIFNVGTQASLVRRQNGSFVLIDACDFDSDTQGWIADRTGGRIEAVLHVHPFHTVYVKPAHELYPEAALYGTSRHVAKAPGLPWQTLHTEDPELHGQFADDFEFDVPRGVDFISSNPKLHFSSVLVIHKQSKTLHVDDTLVCVRLPMPLRLFKKDMTRFHPALAKVLEPRAGAAAEFRSWAENLIARAGDIENLCAAHTTVLLKKDNDGPPIAERVAEALAKVDGALRAHGQRFDAR